MPTVEESPYNNIGLITHLTYHVEWSFPCKEGAPAYLAEIIITYYYYYLHTPPLVLPQVKRCTFTA
jgi:hypothetical protein